MTDLASLGIRVDSTQVRVAETDLDALSRAGGRAETTLSSLGGEAKSAGAGMQSASQAAETLARSTAQAAAMNSGFINLTHQSNAATQQAAFHMQNLSFQVNDIIVSLASGQRPLTVFIQQGAQIAQIMQQAGKGIGGFITEVLRMARIITISSDAILDSWAAEAAAQRTVLASLTERTAATRVAATVEVRLAEAQLASAQSATASALAQARLTTALEAEALAAIEAAAAQEALAVADTEVAATANAAAANRVTSLSKFGGALLAVAAAAGVAYLALKSFKTSLNTNNELEAYARSLDLTEKQFRELQKRVGNLSDKEMQDLNNRAKAFQVTWGDVWAGFTKTVADNTTAVVPIWAAVMNYLEEALNNKIRAMMDLIALLYGEFQRVFTAIKVLWSQLPAILGDIAAKTVNNIIDHLNRLVSGSLVIINGLIAGINSVTGSNLGKIEVAPIAHIKESGAAVKAYTDVLKGAEQGTRQAREAFKDFGADWRKNTYANAKANIDAAAAAIKADESTTSPRARAARKERISDVARETARLADQTKELNLETQVRGKLNTLVAGGSISAAYANEQMQIERSLRHANTLLMHAEGEEREKLKAAIDKYRASLVASHAEELRGKNAADTQALREEIELNEQLREVEDAAALARLQALRGLNGQPLEEALRAINLQRQQDINTIRMETEANKILYEAQETGNKGAIKSAEDLVEQMTELNIQQNEFLSKDAEWDRGTDAIKRMREAVESLVSALSNALSAMGGVGGAFGSLLGALSSANPLSALAGLGGLGSVAALALSPSLFTGSVGLLGNGIQSLIPGIGAGTASLLGTGLGGLGFGSIIGGLVGSKTGGAIGGAIGGLGVSLLGGVGAASSLGGGLAAAGAGASSGFLGLGAAAGPIGVVVGALLGGLLGSLFKDPDQAVATLSLVNGKPGYGNLFKEGDKADQYAQEVSSAAGDVVNALSTITGALGGTLNSSLGNISIGQFKGKWAVNDGSQPGFRGLAAGDPGATVYGSMEEAIRAAINLAIKTSVDGISEQVKTLLTAPGTDLETQIQKAQLFNAVLKDAAEATHPLGEALKALQSQFSELDAIFAEAGATTEQLAQLAQFEVEQRQKLVEEYGRFIFDNFVSDEQKLAEATAAVAAEMERLGLSNVTTKDQFLETARGIDTTTDAGVALYEALVAIAPQFLTVANATEEAAAAAAAAAEEQARVQAEELAKATELANTRLAMEAQLLELQGDKVGALAIKRALELQATDESLRGLQAQIYLQEDINTAKDTLAQAYQNERSQIESLISRYKSMSASLHQLSDSLTSAANETLGYDAALARLKSTGSMAALGDETAIQALGGATQDFLNAARSNAASSLDYQREVARARGIVDNAARGADGLVSQAEAQLAALDESVKGLIDINENTISVKEAIANLTELLETPTMQIAEDTARAIDEDRQAALDLLREIQDLRSDNQVSSARTMEVLNSLNRIWTRVEGEGMLVYGEPESPVYTEAAP